MMRLLPQGLLMIVCAAVLASCGGQPEDGVARGFLDRAAHNDASAIGGFQGGPGADLVAALESVDGNESSLSRIAAPHPPDFTGLRLPPSGACPAASSPGQLLQSAPKTGPPPT